MTVAYVEHVYNSPFGVLDVSDNEVKAVHEKPQRIEKASGGIYAIDPRCLELVPTGEFFTVPNLIEALHEKGEKVGAYPIKKFWKGLESANEYPEVIKHLEMREREESQSRLAPPPSDPPTTDSDPQTGEKGNE